MRICSGALRTAARGNDAHSEDAQGNGVRSQHGLLHQAVVGRSALPSRDLNARMLRATSDVGLDVDGAGSRALRALPMILGFALATLCSSTASAAADLMAVYAKAVEFNPQYQIAQAQYNYDIEARPQALAKLLPQIGAKADANLMKSTDKGGIYLGEDLGLVNLDKTDSYKAPSYAVQLTQALFRPQYFIGLNEADLQVAEAKLALDEARISLIFTVAQAYFGVLSAQDTVRFTQAERDAYKLQLDQGESRHQSGLMSDANFENIKSEHDLAVAAEIESEGQLQVALTQLAEVTGETYTDLKPLSDDTTFSPPEPSTVGSWVSRAVDENPQVVIQQIAVKVARLDYDKTKAARLPTVDLIGAYQYQHPTGGAPQSAREQVDQMIGLEVKAPIYTGGTIDSGIRAAFANWSKAQAQADAARGTAVKSTRSAFFGVTSGLSQINALKQAIQSTRVAEEAARAGYEIGTKTEADLLTAIQNRYKAEKNYSTARYGFLVNSMLLKQSVGSLTEADILSVNRWLH